MSQVIIIYRNFFKNIDALLVRIKRSRINEVLLYSIHFPVIPDEQFTSNKWLTTCAIFRTCCWRVRTYKNTDEDSFDMKCKMLKEVQWTHETFHVTPGAGHTYEVKIRAVAGELQMMAGGLPVGFPVVAHRNESGNQWFTLPSTLLAACRKCREKPALYRLV
jgi:hypothetical protein